MMDEKLIYDPPKVDDYCDLHRQTKKVLEWIGYEKLGIEMGCHTGHLAEWLQKNKCQTIGVDLNSSALEKARPFLVQTIFGNIEDESIYLSLSNKKYDYIIFMHVLEHLIDSEKILRRYTGLLKEEGLIIIGIPNICNAKDRFKITFGSFEYDEAGVMDRTHLRFFNQKSARKLIKDGGLFIEDYYSPWQVNPIKHFFDHIPLLWRLSKKMKDLPPKFYKFTPNITDTVMLFKCRRNEKNIK